VGVSNVLIFLSAALMAVVPPVEQAKPAAATPQVAEMTMKGRLTSQRANPNDPADKRTIYTLEVDEPAPLPPGADPSTPRKTQKRKVQLSPGPSVSLEKYVGKVIQVTGELLQPPGLAPGAEKAPPLPGQAEGTFRVTSVKVVDGKF
jgi:hypothetical protein